MRRVQWRWTDLLPAIGPLLVAAAFLVMLYGLLVPVNLLVAIALGLVYWPLLAFAALLVDLGIAALFREASAQRWSAFRNRFFPLALLAALVGLLWLGNWLALIVFCQCLHHAAEPPSDRAAQDDVLAAAGLMVLLVLAGLVVAFGGAVALSEPFPFPNTSGDLRYLPGMLMLGALAHVVIAVATIASSAWRRAAREGGPETGAAEVSRDGARP